MNRVFGFGLLAALATISSAAFGSDRVFDDGRGNLVFQSASGYKQIVVGQGHRADDIAAALGAATGPAIVAVEGAPKPWRCGAGHALYKGRGYMYGLNRGTAAILDASACRIPSY